MRLCLLVDGIGVPRDLQHAALGTWAAKGKHVSSSWIVRDHRVSDPIHTPGFAFEDESTLWVHQPISDFEKFNNGSAHEYKFDALSSDWPPPMDWAMDRSFQTLTWHVQRRWRLLSSDPVLKMLRPGSNSSAACSLLGYFRANSVVNIDALVAILEQEGLSSASYDEGVPFLIGRVMESDAHGKSTPRLSWADTDLDGAMSSSGFVLNYAAVEQLARSTKANGEGTIAFSHASKLTNWVNSMFHQLSETLAGQREVDGPCVSTLEVLFVACLRSHSRELVFRPFRWPKHRFMLGNFLLQRLIFRLGAAAFEWSELDNHRAGFPYSRWRYRSGHFGMPPQCVLSYYPVNTVHLMNALHNTITRISCLPTAQLTFGTHEASRGVKLVVPGAAWKLELSVVHGMLYAQRPGLHLRYPASRDHSFSIALRRNRRIWKSFIASPGKPTSEAGEHEFFNKFRLSSTVANLLKLNGALPYLHDHEWRRTPSGQARYVTPVTIVLSLPNSGTTWFLFVTQNAQHDHRGMTAVMSDILHPMCNNALSNEVAKVAGAPEDGTWLHIFRANPSPSSLEFAMELTLDFMHQRAIEEVQFMREKGRSIIGEFVPEHLRWPWQGEIDPESDPLNVNMLLTKEIINVLPLVEHVKYSHKIGVEPSAQMIGLYRHRAHTFPMSNSSHTLRKDFMLESMIFSFEQATFADDFAMTGLQKWWRRRKRHVGGTLSICGMVFAHLLVWFTILRADIKVVDYARLMLLGREDLRPYLAENLTPALMENPGVARLAATIVRHRFAEPKEFLEKRERMYAELGVEGFARNAIREMQRLDPTANLTLLVQDPH